MPQSLDVRVALNLDCAPRYSPLLCPTLLAAEYLYVIAPTLNQQNAAATKPCTAAAATPPVMFVSWWWLQAHAHLPAHLTDRAVQPALHLLHACGRRCAHASAAAPISSRAGATGACGGAVWAGVGWGGGLGASQGLLLLLLL